MQKTLGGDRLGSGKKMKIQLHGYERSTHDLSYTWTSTMASGTLIPFLCEVALPGDTFDIELFCEILTHPTIGPLFGRYKTQLDLFQAPIRLYHSKLHNNALGIGLNMSSIKLPTITLTALDGTDNAEDIDNAQINPSALPAYLGIRGIGANTTGFNQTRTFNAIPIIAYWDIYKQYYSNKQEEIGAVIHTPSLAIVNTVTSITIDQYPYGSPTTLPQTPSINLIPLINGSKFTVNFTGTQPLAEQLIVQTTFGAQSIKDLTGGLTLVSAGVLTGTFNSTRWGTTGNATQWDYLTANDINTGEPAIATFPLSYIDDMRDAILAAQTPGTAFDISTLNKEPYKWLYELPNGIPNILSNQEGLGLKTYQSDLYNNWLQTEWIDGPGGISEITSIDTSGGSFTIDTLNLSKKVYDMLNRIAVSGGTYDDWLDAVYTHDRYTRCESPIYHGGLIRELAFQEVVSNAASETTDGVQTLGTLAGKGVMTDKRKGGQATIKVDEPSYIIGIISLTPLVKYSQGNKWDVNLASIDDLHKPGLDEIGFQESINEGRTWWSTKYDSGTSSWVQTSAGKQPAWINYMTNVDQVRGNFAIGAGNKVGEMFMTLNRRFERDENTGDIKDLTTYIDPSKFNFIFAETALDAQNFWAQIGIGMTVRRKMSARLMPNL